MLYNLESLDYKIDNRSSFQKQLINHLIDYKHLIFLNSNDKSCNLLAVSNHSKCIDDGWKFGFITYDYKNKIEKLTSSHFDGIGFPEHFFFTPELLFHIDINVLKVYYDSNIYNEHEISGLIQKVEKGKALFEENKPVKLLPKLTKQMYINNVKTIKEHIQQGDIYEVNYCQEFFAEAIEINPVQLYFKLNEKSPTPFSCFVKHKDKYLLSASPERFIKKQENKIISQPIKGTIGRGKNKIEDERLKDQLFNDKKERSENIMIVDLVRNDLSKISQKQSVKVDELCGIYTFPQVHQMISTVSADLKKDVIFDDIIKATFPMGSMTGAPKIRAMELIEKYETSKRGLYSGTVGYIDSFGNFDFNVVIRSILYNKDTQYLSFFVGGAITHLSNPEKEYEECLLKAKAMFEVLC